VHKLLLILPLMAAILCCAGSCGRLGYDEHTRTPRPADAGSMPPPDDDAGEP
jgi:hypothetical protein